jgi:hypothetical protein
MTPHGDASGNPVSEERMNKALSRICVPVVAALGGFAGGYVILPWGLVTPFFIVAPLGTGYGALLAALGAGWVGTLLAPDRTRLLPVVIASGVASTGAMFTVLLAPVPLIFRLALGTGIIALVASWATWRFRARGGVMDRDAAITLSLAVAVTILSLLTLQGSVIRSVFGASAGVIAIPLGVLAGVAAVILGLILMRSRFRGPGNATGRDAALTLGLSGLPVPVFYGAYYLAFLLNLTSG